MAESTLVLVTRSPYGLEEAFAGLRLALAIAVNGMKTSVVLAEDGVYNALASQNALAVKMPSNMEATKELYDFDVPVYVVKEDLEAREIDESMLFEGLKVVPASKIRNWSRSILSRPRSEDATQNPSFDSFYYPLGDAIPCDSR